MVETINPTAFSPLSCTSFAYHPRLGHRVRPWTLSSPTHLVVDVKESTTHAANLVVFPYRLPLPSIFSRARLPPTFWSSTRHLCCFLSPPKKRPSVQRSSTDTLHLSPRDIVIALALLHGTMTGAEVDALRLPLRKELTAVSAPWSHRGVQRNPWPASNSRPSSSSA